MPTFAPIPLGRPIPDTPHGVSCSMPTLRAVRGYEEKNPEIVRQMTSGYPRFVVHPFARELAARLAPPGRTLWLTSSARMAGHLADWLGRGGHPGATRFEQGGLHGLSHPVSAETAARANLFLQHVGGFLPSREAEDAGARLGLRPPPRPESLFEGEAGAEVRRHLRPLLEGASDADLFLANSGANAVYAAFRAVDRLQAAAGRTAWLQLGWLYLDTIAVLKKFTGSPGNYLHHADVLDLPGLERLFAREGSRLAGVIAEVPTNPLVQTPDVPRLAELCRRHGAALILDPSVASLSSVDVLGHSDLLVASLTKYTASEGDVMAGLLAVNPAGPRAAELRRAAADWVEPPYARDLARLAWQIGRTGEVLARIQAGVPKLVAFLQGHPKVREVHWALHPDSRANFLRVARRPDATGGMVSFSIRGPLEAFYDRLRLPKGPSFGMKTTLICPYLYLAHYDLVTSPAGRAELAASGIDPELLRLCLGVEPVEDVIADLAQALA